MGLNIFENESFPSEKSSMGSGKMASVIKDALNMERVNPEVEEVFYEQVFFLVTHPLVVTGCTYPSSLYKSPDSQTYLMTGDNRRYVISRLRLFKEEEKYLADHPEDISDRTIIPFECESPTGLKISTSIYCHEVVNKNIGEKEMTYVSFNVF